MNRKRRVLMSERQYRQFRRFLRENVNDTHDSWRSISPKSSAHWIVKDVTRKDFGFRNHGVGELYNCEVEMVIFSEQFQELFDDRIKFIYTLSREGINDELVYLDDKVTGEVDFEYIYEVLESCLPDGENDSYNVRKILKAITKDCIRYIKKHRI